MLTGISAKGQQVLPGDSTSDAARTGMQLLRLRITAIQKQLENIGNDTTAVKLMNELAKAYINFSYDSSLLYSSKARELSTRISYPQGLVTAILQKGYAEEVVKNNRDTAIVYYQQAIEAAKKNKLNGMLDDLYSIIHNSYVYKGNFPLAMTIANEGLEAAKKRDDRRQMLHYTSLIAAAYFRQGLNEQALAEYRKGETIAGNLGEYEKASHNLVTIADIYYGFGDVYNSMGDTSAALRYLEKAYNKFRELDSDKTFWKKYMVANTLYMMGVVNKTAGNLPKALQYVRQTLDFCKNGNCNLYEKAAYYLQAGDLLRLLGKYDEAGKQLYYGKKIAEEIKHAENKRDAYYYLSLYYSDLKKFDSAWQYNKQYALLKDSIINERTRFRTEEINAIYGIAEKDSKIAWQNNLRNILIASFLFLLLTLGLLYSRNRLRQRNRYQQELNHQQNELFNAISLAQEQERKRIAQDIHDSLGSVLSAAKLKMVELKDELPELNMDEKFLSGIGLLDEASSELRNISYNIMPATLTKLGLVPALKNLTNKISTYKGLQVAFIAHEFEIRLNEQNELSIYRIILELINNVVKHAGATKATIQLVKYTGYINITVEDNGKGFDVQKAHNERKGIGLGSVAARVEYLKGTLDIDSAPGKGTIIIIDIPSGN
ncbi:MAG: sensor histidine kinase [Sphingobacteriales bacterium]|nr:sensor histidine kinase [Sphingobacteriales bacterium]